MLAIKNMEMPKDCGQCKLRCITRDEYGMPDHNDYCIYTGKEISGVIFDKRHKDCPLIEINPLTDDEKRIFLSAMNREEGLCEAIDNEKVDDGSVKKLLPIVKKIERKVKKALWR